MCTLLSEEYLAQNAKIKEADMISYCDGCGETYKEENLIDCPGGGSYCYRCYNKRCKQKEQAPPRKDGRRLSSKTSASYQFLVLCANHWLEKMLTSTKAAKTHSFG